MKIGVHIYLDKILHKKAKKRAIDLDTNLSEYIAKLIKNDLDKTRSHNE
jgi:hypothetical protein